jgi:hypothetical protein
MKNHIDNKELEKYINDIKQDLLFHIITNLRAEKVTLGQAKYLSKDFLALLPVQDKEEILNKLYSLTSLYGEARAVFVKYIGPFEEEKTMKKLAVARKYMQNKEYEKALQSMKGVV